VLAGLFVLKHGLQTILNYLQLSLTSNIQKMIIGNHSRSLILESSEHLLCSVSFVLSLWRTMNTAISW